MTNDFQLAVKVWTTLCFGDTIAQDKVERNFRFLEESLELVQACGCTQAEAHQLVDYVYGRDVGEIRQEVGGVMVTLAALCNAQSVQMDWAARDELNRAHDNIDKIREKQKNKPHRSPLPE